MKNFQAIADKLPRLTINGEARPTIPDSVGPKRRAAESAAAKWVSVWALIHDGKPAGSIVWSIGQSGMHGWTCDLRVHAGPMQPLPLATGTASGCGYCKRSASFADALHRLGIDAHDISGRGEGAIRQYLEANGYTVAECI